MENDTTVKNQSDIKEYIEKSKGIKIENPIGEWMSVPDVKEDYDSVSGNKAICIDQFKNVHHSYKSYNFRNRQG